MYRNEGKDMIKAESNLYAYKIDGETFDKVALSFYMSSGKFDKNSMSRWTATMTRYKAQLLRASIDNSVVFLPVGDTSSRVDREDLRNSLIVICCDTRVYAVGIVVQGPCKCPDEYKITSMIRLIAVHVLSTSFTTDVRLADLDDVEHSDYLPGHIYKLTDTIADAVDVEKPMTWEYAYEKQIMFAHWFFSYLEILADIETPSRKLEIERRNRIRCMQDFLQNKSDATLPPPRPFSFQKTMKTHEKYARLFGRLLK